MISLIIELFYKQLKEVYPILLEFLAVLLWSLKLWCLNLTVPFCFIFMSPILISDFADIPLAVFSFFKFWLVDGFKFQLVFFGLCFLMTICNDK